MNEGIYAIVDNSTGLGELTVAKAKEMGKRGEGCSIIIYDG